MFNLWRVGGNVFVTIQNCIIKRFVCIIYAYLCIAPVFCNGCIRLGRRGWAGYPGYGHGAAARCTGHNGGCRSSRCGRAHRSRRARRHRHSGCLLRRALTHHRQPETHDFHIMSLNQPNCTPICVIIINVLHNAIIKENNNMLSDSSYYCIYIQLIFIYRYAVKFWRQNNNSIIII